MQPLSEPFKNSVLASAPKVRESIRVPANDLTKFIAATKIADQQGFKGKQYKQFVMQYIQQANHFEAQAFRKQPPRTQTMPQQMVHMSQQQHAGIQLKK